jgi:hypothetical protein
VGDAILFFALLFPATLHLFGAEAHFFASLFECTLIYALDNFDKPSL